MANTIRNLQGEELLSAVYALDVYAFHPSPPSMTLEDWAAPVRERKGMNCFAVFEDEKPVAVAVSTPMTQNLRGSLYPVAGVWGVATHPAARRKGYCRQAMQSLLAADRGLGKVFSNLYPFRESFYERMGYVSLNLAKIARIAPSSFAPLLKMEMEGEIDLKLIGEAYEEYREFLAEMRQDQHGMAFFDFGDRARANRNMQWAAMAKFGGKTEGLMLYSLQGQEVGKFNFTAGRFYYRTSRARYLMLQWIARHIDQADRVEIWLPDHEHPEGWLADLQVKSETQIRPAMNRVLDVENIGGLTVGEGEFMAKVQDPMCPWNEGIWRFASQQGKLQVSRALKADFDLTIQGLTGLIIGTRDPEDFALRGWGNPDPARQVILRGMFPAMNPYLHEFF